MSQYNDIPGKSQPGPLRDKLKHPFGRDSQYHRQDDKINKNIEPPDMNRIKTIAFPAK